MLITLLFFFMSGYIILMFVVNRAILKNVNALQIRLDEVERRMGLMSGGTWVAVVKRKGQRYKEKIELTASGESDALRQLLQRGLSGTEVLSLERATGPNPPIAA